jgi:uncharacterized protein YndB with AHSA1/START domain
MPNDIGLAAQERSVRSPPGKPRADTRPSLTLKRRLAATPAQVYAAWTEPSQLMRWFGPHGATMIAADVDARADGRFHATFRTPDGQKHDVSCVYREVVPNERLVMSWAWRSMPERESQLTVSLRADGDATMLTLTHERFVDEAARDDHRDGWTGALDRLEAYFA